MAGSQISTSVSIIDSLSGFMALSLTAYNTSAVRLSAMKPEREAIILIEVEI